MILGCLALTRYFPVSLRPEDRFRAILRRFFRSCEFLMATTDWPRGRASSRLQRWRKAFHLSEVSSAPGKLESWARALPAAALGQATPAQVQDMVTSLQALSYRMQTLMQAQPADEPDAVMGELLADVRAWRIGVQQVFARLSASLDEADAADLRGRVDALLARLETRVQNAVDSASESRVSRESGEIVYRLLGAHRGVSEAIIEVTEKGGIDWSRLREARF
jgi:hypothetical protein